MRGQVRNQLHALLHNPVVIDHARQLVKLWYYGFEKPAV